MQLLPINTNQNPQTFKAKKYIKYNDIKNIPDITCACCGKKVLNPELFQTICIRIERPLSSAIKLGLLDVWKSEPEIWNVLQKLATENPKQSFNKICKKQENYDSLNTAIYKMINRNSSELSQDEKFKSRKNLYKDMMYRARGILRSASVVMKKIAPIKKYLENRKLEVFEQLEIYAQKYPKKTLSEIINIDEIAKFHHVKDLLQRAETREKIDFHFENIKKIINKKSPHPDEYYAELKEEALNTFEYVRDSVVRREKIKQLYLNVLQENNCEELKNKVTKEIEKMPITCMTKDSFLTYAHNHNYNDNQILSSLFGPVTSTFEHIVPRSQEGKNLMENGLVMHHSCNEKRGTMPYTEFLKYHPEMKKNTQKQVNFIAKLILNNEIDSQFKTWPISISKTLYKYTQGIINLDISEYCEKSLEHSIKSIEEKNTTIEKLKNQKDYMKRTQQELQNKIKDLQKDANNVNSDICELKQQNSQEQEFINCIENYLETKNQTKAKQE